MKIDYSEPEDHIKTISTKKIAQDLNFEIIYYPEDRETFVKSVDVNRPSLQLAGFFEVFSFERIQIIGLTEWKYMKTLSHERLRQVLDEMFKYDLPLIVFTSGLETDEIVIEKAKEYKRPIVRSDKRTTKLTSIISAYLNSRLSEEVTIHGVLMDVDGVGVLITGESGVGKSETALELLKMNHRLVADDAVKIRRFDEETLIGSAPDILQNLLEVRGIGILNIKNLYGVGAVKLIEEIDLNIHLEAWDEDKYYDRLGIEDKNIEILATKIDSITLPVKPGRNIAIIIEVAARNYRQKIQGRDPALEIDRRLEKAFGGR